MRLPRFRTTSFGLLGVALFASPAWAQTSPPEAAAVAPRLNDAAELARVVGLYEAGKYGACADSLHLLLSDTSARPLRDPDVVESARIYHAACLIGSGDQQRADEPLRAAIRQNPQMKPPDGLVFPPQVIDRFLRVRETMFDVIKKAEDERVKKAQDAARQQEARARRERTRVAGLERLGQDESVITPHSRWLGLVPFGAGQFQNGKETLGYVFLASEVLLAGGTILSLGVETHLVLKANQIVAGGHKPDPSINGTLTNWKTGLDYSSYAWLGVSIVGIVEAELSFAPEHRVIRKRPLPPELAPEHGALRVVPMAGPVPGGGVLGVSGEF